jgi:hypothetical protein
MLVRALLTSSSHSTRFVHLIILDSLAINYLVKSTDFELVGTQ